MSAFDQSGHGHRARKPCGLRRRRVPPDLRFCGSANWIEFITFPVATVHILVNFPSASTGGARQPLVEVIIQTAASGQTALHVFEFFYAEVSCGSALARALFTQQKRGVPARHIVVRWATGTSGMRSQQAAGKTLLLPIATGVLAAGIFAVDTITDSEIAFPAFYTAIVLLSVGFCKKNGVVFVGIGCIALTLLSDLLTVNSGVSEAGVINTAISFLAIATTTFLAIKIQSAEIVAVETQSQLAHVVRVTALGELAATIAHEVNQPLTAAVINGNACLEWLAAHPPNLDEVKRAVGLLVKDAHRASHVLAQVRALTKGSTSEKGPLNINKTILATVTLIDREIQRSQVSLQTQLSDDVPIVDGDRVQLQQVILNLLLNGIEAIKLVAAGPKDLIISSAKSDSNDVLISVQDSGAGFAPADLDRLFNAFYTTKPDGMGMGLAISRTIIENHCGRIWATPNSPRGAVLQFTLPIGRELIA
jgi:signal transduction histidine kinase